MMPHVVLWPVLATVLLLDMSLQRWRPWQPAGLRALAYLAVAYVPMFVLPLLPTSGVVGLAALVSLFAALSMARMVGLTQHPRYFLPTWLLIPVSFWAAYRGSEDALAAVPVCGMFAVALAAVTDRSAPAAVLQKLCLAWLQLWVFAALWAHVAVFPRLHLQARLGLCMASLILLCKIAAVSGALVERLWLKTWGWPVLLASAMAGAMGGAVLGPTAFMSPQIAAGVGALCGLATGAAGRCYDRVVDDVAQGAEQHPTKGSMLFAFGFAVPLTLHFLRAVLA